MMMMDNYAAGIMLDADPPCERCERLQETVENYAYNLDQFRKQCDQLEAENKRLRHRVWLWKKMAEILHKAQRIPSWVSDRTMGDELVRLETEVDRLRAVVKQAHQFAVWMQITEWYAISPKVKKSLAALETAATAVLAEGEQECPTIPPPAHVASVAPRLLSGTEYQETVAAIAQRLLGKPDAEQPCSRQTTNESSPSAPLTCSCDTGESGCACSRG